MSKLVLIDGNAIMHRAFHAMPRLTSKKGEPIGAVYGLVSMLLRITSDLKPSHLAVCFDRKEPTFRKKQYESYQAQRPKTDKELSEQFVKARDVLKAANISVFDKKGFEADDLIGTISKFAGNAKKINETVIVTGDKDILQLVDDKKKVGLYMPIRGFSDSKIFTEKDVFQKLGVKVDQIIDYKALVGDPSDNYPGVFGVGPKTAEKLLEKFDTFPNIYKNLDDIDKRTREKLEKGKEGGEISYKLARIVRDVSFSFDLSKMDDWDFGSEEAVNLFLDFGFKTLTKRVGGELKRKKRLRKNLTRLEIEKVALKIVKKLKDKNYAIRGTASMVLQGLDMGVDDIDIVTDKELSKKINDIFETEIVEEIKFSESEKFRSHFGKLIIDNILIEVMGEFQVKDDKGNWSEKVDASVDQIEQVTVGNEKINVTKLGLELDLSAKMGRWNEFHKIKKQLEEKSQASLF